jgi:hypothetical protein
VHQILDILIMHIRYKAFWLSMIFVSHLQHYCLVHAGLNLRQDESYEDWVDGRLQDGRDFNDSYNDPHYGNSANGSMSQESTNITSTQDGERIFQNSTTNSPEIVQDISNASSNVLLPFQQSYNDITAIMSNIMSIDNFSSYDSSAATNFSRADNSSEALLNRRTLNAGERDVDFNIHWGWHDDGDTSGFRRDRGKHTDSGNNAADVSAAAGHYDAAATTAVVARHDYAHVIAGYDNAAAAARPSRYDGGCHGGGYDGGRSDRCRDLLFAGVGGNNHGRR